MEKDVLKSITATALAAELGGLVYDLRWLLLAALSLVVADLFFGAWCAIADGDKVRFSRALNRTLAKIVGYLCYILVGGAAGMAVGEPFGVPSVKVAAVIGGLVLLMELSSVVGHVTHLHGWKVDVKGLLVSWLRSKSEAAASAVEENVTEEKGQAHGSGD